jgi:uncharacterized protein DUF6319
MSLDTLVPETSSADYDTPEILTQSEQNAAPAAESPGSEAPKKASAKKTGPRKTKTLELTLTVTGTADGEWRAELKKGSTYVARDLAVAAAAVSRAAKELHEDLSGPIDAVIEEARAQQSAKIAALESELEAARKALAELD